MLHSMLHSMRDDTSDKTTWGELIAFAIVTAIILVMEAWYKIKKIVGRG